MPNEKITKIFNATFCSQFTKIVIVRLRDVQRISKETAETTILRTLTIVVVFFGQSVQLFHDSAELFSH